MTLFDAYTSKDRHAIHPNSDVCDAMSSDIQKGDGFVGQADLTMFTINAFAFRGKTTTHYGIDVLPDYKKTRPQQNLNNLTATAIMVLIF